MNRKRRSDSGCNKEKRNGQARKEYKKNYNKNNNILTLESDRLPKVFNKKKMLYVNRLSLMKMMKE